jgi:ABC-type uncharacterized transport system permease subunit
MEERVFFEYEDVKVTNSRFIVEGQTFAMNNITSVKALERKPSRSGPLLLILVAVLAILYAETSIAIICALAGVMWWFLEKKTFHIMLRTSGGETSALKTHQREYVSKVVAALNEPIVHRG